MGVGTPEEIVEYANLGIDMMDCVLPTRAARHGLLFTSEGKISIKQATIRGRREARSTRIAPARFAAATRAPTCVIFMRRMKCCAQVLNTIHNLSFYLDTMRRVRHSI